MDTETSYQRNDIRARKRCTTSTKVPSRMANETHFKHG